MKATHRVVLFVEAYDGDEARDIVHSGDINKMSIIEIVELGEIISENHSPKGKNAAAQVTSPLPTDTHSPQEAIARQDLSINGKRPEDTLSNCCTARIKEDSDVCSKCKEHCGEFVEASEFDRNKFSVRHGLTKLYIKKNKGVKG